MFSVIVAVLLRKFLNIKKNLNKIHELNKCKESNNALDVTDNLYSHLKIGSHSTIKLTTISIAINKEQSNEKKKILHADIEQVKLVCAPAIFYCFENMAASRRFSKYIDRCTNFFENISKITFVNLFLECNILVY